MDTVQISNEIIKILEYLGTKIGITIDWTSTNILPYAEQIFQKFIEWEFSTSLAWIIIVLCASALTFIFAITVKGWDGIEWVCFGIVVAISIIVICCQVFDMVECRVFPEKAVYDYIQMYLVKK